MFTSWGMQLLWTLELFAGKVNQGVTSLAGLCGLQDWKSYFVFFFTISLYKWQ